MRRCVVSWLALLACVGLCAGCSDDDDGYSCGMQTTGIAGVAPDCMVWLECDDGAEWQLD